MDDLISRSDAIGAVKEERFPIDSDYAEGFMAALDKVEWILKEWVPSAQPDMSEYSDKLWKAAYERGKAEAQQRWIPCSERMPEAGQKCLVCERGTIAIDTYIGRGKPYDWRWYMRDYDAWMPLPEPYKEGE